jgi:hypothetical protein
VSSAILYVAIVAIWACVLIPRWLRRDTARGADATADTAVPGDVVPGDLVPGDVPGDVAGEDDTAGTVRTEAPIRMDAPVRAEATVRADATVAADATVRTDASADGARGHARAERMEDQEPDRDGGAPPATPEEARQRMMAARRRLLGMLAVLEVAAIALAVSRFAALWVLIPPSVMFAAYLLLLREAARGDAERSQREAEAERARATAQARAERAARLAEAARVPVAPQAPATAPRRAARYEDASLGGRDFAPGLAGKYTTSNAAVIDRYEGSDEDFRDQYTTEELRAVGD